MVVHAIQLVLVVYAYALLGILVNYVKHFNSQQILVYQQIHV